MKLILPLFLLFLLGLGGCKKDTSPDDIYYVAFPSPSALYSLDSSYVVYPIGGDPHTAYVPEESSAEMLLDIDDDGVNDFGLYIQHHLYSQTPGPYEPSLAHSLTFKGLQSDYEVLINDEPYDHAKYISEGDLISEDAAWKNSIAIFQLSGVSWVPSDNFYGEQYFGFRIKQGYKYRYGWVLIESKLEGNSNNKKRFYVKSFALNRVNYHIIAGQTN